MYRQSEKKFVKQQSLLHVCSQYGELRPTIGWDRFGSLGHPSYFQRLPRLGNVTARHVVVGVSQTLRRWTEAPPIFGRAAIRLGIGPHSSWCCFVVVFVCADVAKFLCVTLKRVSLPSAASSQRLALMKRLDELQQSYPQLYWELEDDDASRSDQTEPVSASSMKHLFYGLNVSYSNPKMRHQQLFFCRPLFCTSLVRLF